MASGPAGWQRHVALFVAIAVLLPAMTTAQYGECMSLGAQTCRDLPPPPPPCVACSMPLHAAAARMSPPLACRHSPQPAGRPSTERGSLVCNGTLSADDISTMLDDFFYDAQDVSRASISFENANITGLNLAYATAVAFKMPNQPFVKLSFKDCIIARNQVS